MLLAKKLNAGKTLEIDDICKKLRISRSTFYRYVRLWRIVIPRWIVEATHR